MSLFLIVLLISGVSTVTERIMPRILASLVAAVTALFSVLHQITPARGVTTVWYLSTIGFFSILIAVLLKRVFGEGPVTAHRIRGAIAVYLLIGMTWAIIYQLIAFFIPRSFSFPSSMIAQPAEQELESALVYFSYVTMATLGYGDIVPVHPVARMFAIFEALVGLLYPATLLARLVSLEIMHGNERKENRERRGNGAER